MPKSLQILIFVKLVFYVPVLFPGYSSACLSSLFAQEPAWNGLKVTWGVNPLSSYTFASMPRTQADATRQGWKLISNANNSPFCGRRMIKFESKINADDSSAILIYDKNGYIAGIQTAIPDNLNNFPSSAIQPPFVRIGNQFFITAYFSDPGVVCGDGRTREQFNEQGTGTMLVIQNGTDPTNVIRIPMNEADVEDPRSYFTKGKCFWTMGDHYWASTAGKVTRDMDCDNFFPMFLLYNRRKLNGFGWAFGTGGLASPRFEHPTSTVLDKFMPSPVPDCLYQISTFSTIHIFMTDSPASNFC